MTAAPAPRASGAVLWGRSLLVAVVAMLVGGVAHVEAGGLLPGPAVLALLVLAGTLAVAPLLRRPASAVRVVLLLVAGQGWCTRPWPSPPGTAATRWRPPRRPQHRPWSRPGRSPGGVVAGRSTTWRTTRPPPAVMTP